MAVTKMMKIFMLLSLRLWLWHFNGLEATTTIASTTLEINANVNTTLSTESDTNNSTSTNSSTTLNTTGNNQDANLPQTQDVSAISATTSATASHSMGSSAEHTTNGTSFSMTSLYTTFETTSQGSGSAGNDTQDDPGELRLNRTTCPSTVTEGSSLRCECGHSSSGRGSNSTKVFWTNKTSSAVLDIHAGLDIHAVMDIRAVLDIHDIKRNLNGTVFVCRSVWGPNDTFHKEVNYTLFVISETVPMMENVIFVTVIAASAAFVFVMIIIVIVIVVKKSVAAKRKQRPGHRNSVASSTTDEYVEYINGAYQSFDELAAALSNSGEARFSVFLHVESEDSQRVSSVPQVVTSTLKEGYTMNEDGLLYITVAFTEEQKRKAELPPPERESTEYATINFHEQACCLTDDQ